MRERHVMMTATFLSVVDLVVVVVVIAIITPSNNGTANVFVFILAIRVATIMVVQWGEVLVNIIVKVSVMIKMNTKKCGRSATV
jgi:hypothetical protein